MDNNLTGEEMKKRLEWYEKRYGSYIEKRGLHNWKNLFRKPTFSEWIILALLLLGLFIAYAYQHDISACREYLNLYAQQNNISNLTINYTHSGLGVNISLKEETNMSNNAEGG